MKHLIKIIIISIICFSNLQLFSQKGYYNGYVITNSNDTIFGLIKDRKEPPFGKIYKKIQVKADQKQFFAKKFSANEISEYKINNSLYESHWYYSYYNLFNEEIKSINGLGKKVFLKVITKDYLSYYQLEYYDSETDTFETIDLFKRQNEDYFVKATQGIFGLKKKKLSIYFQDYPELAYKITTKQIKTPSEVVYYYNYWYKHKNNN